MNILIAPNAFKNSLDAQSVAEAIALGFKQSNLDCTCTLFPVADGGDGTGPLLIRHLNGKVIDAAVHDALGRPIIASWGLIDNEKTAVIEMADASGIRLLKPAELDPLKANTIGTGELIKAALDKGVKKIIMGMGGSATVDGGTGILQALGIRFISIDKEVLTQLPWSLSDLNFIDTSGLDKRILDCKITVLCDVDNPLVGPNGAAAVFAPQKGADQVSATLLGGILDWFATIQFVHTGKDITKIKYGGTAGGAAAGMYAFLNAELVGGANQFLALTGFNSALENIDLVITGEGSLDEQTLQGKAPLAVAVAAKAHNIKVIGMAGKIADQHNEALNSYFDALYQINDGTEDLARALQNTRADLIRTAKLIGDSMA